MNYSVNVKLYSKVVLYEMGSFSSKVRSIRSGVSLYESSKEDIDDGIERESHVTASVTEMAENSTPQGQAGVTNGDASNTGASTSHEQHAAPKVGQSFSWLASTPVVFNPTTKEHKAKGKRPVEGRKVSAVMKYSNEKYLKSWQASVESLPSNANRNAQPSPSTSTDDHEVNKVERRNKQGNIGDGSSSRSGNFPVGFGVVGKHPSPKDSTRSQLTVRKSQRQTLSLEGKDEECP